MSKIISRDQVLQKIKEKSCILIDVRNPNEFENGSIPSAINLPLANLEKAAAEEELEFRNQVLDKLPKSLDAEIIVYCQSGRRAGKALALLEEKPFQYKNVLNYEGSWGDWSKQL